jgi:pyroglutamyl-peptidase
MAIRSQIIRPILVTGFDPFGGESINPSWEVVQRLPDVVRNVPIVKAQLPRSFSRGPKVLLALAKKHKPVAILSLGQAGGRTAITPERVAVNVMDAERLADNDGAMPSDRRIVAKGADAHLASLPIKAMVEAIRAAGLPSEVSNTAGLFVCNCVLYHALQWAQNNDAIAGFTHIPYLPQQAIGRNAPSMALDDMVRGIAAALAVVERATQQRRGHG